MILKLLIFVLGLFGLLRKIPATPSMGPLGYINLNSIYECNEPDIPEGDEMKITTDLIKINDQGDKAVNIFLKNKIPIDDTMNLLVDIKKFEFGNWSPFYNIKGKPCRALNQFLKKFWTKILKKVEPKIDGACPISPGSYKVDKFEFNSVDFDIKTIFYGKLMVKVILTDQNGKLVYCVNADADSQSPM